MNVLRIALAGFASTFFSVAIADDTRLQLPRGFRATLFADDDLAHDVYSLTTDSLGRVVVSGPGYVRILIDEDGDGRADSFRQFADGPKSGAQGMYFHDRDLLCVGDAGLIRYRDRNRDDRADGPPDVFLRVKTGGEHHVHAIRRGPDGWWYLIAGNFAGIDGSYATLATSPVRSPEAGTLIRLKPDMTGGEIVADGFRNAYDFDFADGGDVFVYDSDGERDVSLPWYRPTRVFQALPASHAGWVSRSWKRPGTFPDMPPVVGAFGRGSPTGVVCYRHDRFPAPYRGAVFVLDWTFGRVIALPLSANGSVSRSEPIVFATGKGQFGFAPTDAAVGPDGALYVSVGGRGTRGGVFRIEYTGRLPVPVEHRDPLDHVLTRPQPLASWSRSEWLRLAQRLGRQRILQAALEPERPTSERVRAIEIYTDLFGGLDAAGLRSFTGDAVAAVRARAVWSHGRGAAGQPNAGVLTNFLADDSALVRRFALQALLTTTERATIRTVRAFVLRNLGVDDPRVRATASRVVARFPDEFRDVRAADTRRSRARLALGLGRTQRQRTLDTTSLDTAFDLLAGNATAAVKYDAARLAQLALGDVGETKKRAPVFEGYTSRIDLEKHERKLDPYRIRLAEVFPTGDRNVDRELGRVVAMLAPYNADLLKTLLARITEASDPVDDIHHLIVAAAVPVERSNAQIEAIAEAFTGLDAKITRHELNRDLNWDDRIGELYAAHVKLDPDRRLPIAIVRDAHFGSPGHVLFLSELPKSGLPAAVAKFVSRIEADRDYAWSNDVVFLLGESSDARHRDLVRAKFDDFGLRSAVLKVLAEKPEERDRDKFVEGLADSPPDVLGACIGAIEKLAMVDDAAANVALFATLRRLGPGKTEGRLRQRIARLLVRNTGESFGFDFDAAPFRPSSELLEEIAERLRKRYGASATVSLFGDGDAIERLQERLRDLRWERGDAARGATLFTKRGCVQCHGGRRALGPDLVGVAGRFSVTDLFTAIAFPNRDVSPRYRATQIVTTDGRQYAGLVIYNSTDGLILRDPSNRTFRIESDEIELRRKLSTSLMPTGLLKGLSDDDLADLYAHLRNLGRR